MLDRQWRRYGLALLSFSAYVGAQYDAGDANGQPPTIMPTSSAVPFDSSALADDGASAASTLTAQDEPNGASTNTFIAGPTASAGSNHDAQDDSKLADNTVSVDVAGPASTSSQVGPDATHDIDAHPDVKSPQNSAPLDDTNAIKGTDAQLDADIKADTKAQYDLVFSDSEVHYDDFFQFVTRPDIQAPRWNLTVYKPGHIAPGYWFTSPYEHVFQRSPQPPWTGPHIFDNNGELVWSGKHLCDHSDCFDFRVSSVRGEDLLSFMYRASNAAVLVDQHYQVRKTAHVAYNLGDLNMHDLNIIDNGNRALVLQKHPGRATEEMSRTVGYRKGGCTAAFDGFKEMDTRTQGWDTVFHWSSSGHIGLNESTKVDKPVDERCEHHWDYVHLNSVDKCPDGNFLLSARHADAIYKIDSKSGKIIWRIGGVMSDFEGNFTFSRQHHIRCREQNHTHTIISFLDNARGSDQEEPSHEYSRGLVIALQTDGKTLPMPMAIVAEYPHPDHGFANSRGNLEPLPNGNVFMGWADGSEFSEHTADGSLIMKASLKPKFLASYRTYKYKFVGHPKELPAVYAEQIFDSAVPDPKGHPSLVTRVFVSWNGATEVASWNLNATSSSGHRSKLVATTEKQGFESMITYNDTADYVLVEALDGKGRPLENGASKIFKTVRKAVPFTETLYGTLDDQQVGSPEKEDEDESVPEKQEDESAPSDASENEVDPQSHNLTPKTSALTNPAVTFVAGLIISAFLVIIIWRVRRSWTTDRNAWWRNLISATSYQPLSAHGEAEDGENGDKMDEAFTSSVNPFKKTHRKRASTSSVIGAPVAATAAAWNGHSGGFINRS